MILVDAVVLYDLGQIGELDLLEVFDGDLVIPRAVVGEVTVEPAATNLARFLDEHPVETDPDTEAWLGDAAALLAEPRETSDVALIAGVLAARERGEPVGFVSDDRRLRAVADGLGATVTGTFGVTTRAAVESKYFPPSQAKRVIRRTDHHGVQMTGRLRERAIGEVDS